MPKKGALTKDLIVARAAELFNSMGYFRASMSDLMEATGLEKGGIYNHFGSKDELALAAFDYAIGVFGSRIVESISACTTAPEKLHALIDGFKIVVRDPPLPGGCPILNGAIESDNGNPALREKVRGAMNRFLAFFKKIIEEGKTDGSLKEDIDSESMATFIVCSFEGAMMMTMLYQEFERMDVVVDQLHAHVNANTK